jgi:predicted membrane-bound spermidine synthase
MFSEFERLMKNNFEKIKNIRLLDVVLLASFFLSGCCALMYQVGWQRILYGIIGVDIDSVTIIVSVFMLGIGFGGMLGGWIADLAPHRRIHYYAAAEISIALYGWVSIAILKVIGDWSVMAGGAAWWSGVVSFVFLMVPTILMGMTLPLLTMAFNEWKKNIGVSVGRLYFFNTLGAAFGAGLVPFLLLPQWPLDQVIRLAVFGNVLVAVIALFSYKWQVVR